MDAQSTNTILRCSIENTTEELRRVIVLHNFSIYYKIIEDKKEIRFIVFWDNRNDPDELDLN